jgi:RHS repeat-associated protein
VGYSANTTDRTLLFYDGQQILWEKADSAAYPYVYVYGIGIDEPLMRYENDTKVFFHFNQLGSVTSLTDSSGNILERYDYDAYGQVTVYNSSGTEQSMTNYNNRYTFTGRELDWSTALIHYRARAYKPATGRFLQRDPKVSAFNLYSYVGNSPTRYLDPDGCQIRSGAWGGNLTIEAGCPKCGQWIFAQKRELKSVTVPLFEGVITCHFAYLYFECKVSGSTQVRAGAGIVFGICQNDAMDAFCILNDFAEKIRKDLQNSYTGNYKTTTVGY